MLAEAMRRCWSSRAIASSILLCTSTLQRQSAPPQSELLWLVVFGGADGFFGDGGGGGVDLWCVARVILPLLSGRFRKLMSPLPSLSKAMWPLGSVLVRGLSLA